MTFLTILDSINICKINNYCEIEKKLKNYFCYFKNDDILVISEDKSVLPFAYIINDYNYPDFLLLSLSIDYPNPIPVADITLIANKVKEVVLSEVFYISPSDGKTYFHDEAYERFELDNLPLEDLEPISSEKH